MTLRLAHQSFRMTLCPTRLHHSTKLSYKRFSGSGDIVRQTSIDILNLGVSLTLKTATKFSHTTLWLIMMYYQTKFGCKGISSLEDRVDAIVVWLCKPKRWPWPWSQHITVIHGHSDSNIHPRPIYGGGGRRGMINPPSSHIQVQSFSKYMCIQHLILQLDSPTCSVHKLKNAE